MYEGYIPPKSEDYSGEIDIDGDGCEVFGQAQYTEKDVDVARRKLNEDTDGAAVREVARCSICMDFYHRPLSMFKCSVSHLNNESLIG